MFLKHQTISDSVNNATLHHFIKEHKSHSKLHKAIQQIVSFFLLKLRTFFFFIHSGLKYAGIPDILALLN